MESVYDLIFQCCECGKPIGEKSSKNKERVIRSWCSICMKCLNKLKKGNSFQGDNFRTGGIAQGTKVYLYK